MPNAPAGTIYRGREGMWSWVAHRVTGVGIFFFLFAHVLFSAFVRVSPEIYNTVIATYKNPSHVATYVMSANHNCPGPVTLSKRRSTRSGATGRGALVVVERRLLRRLTPSKPSSLIKRAMRRRLTRMPIARNSA